MQQANIDYSSALLDFAQSQMLNIEMSDRFNRLLETLYQTIHCDALAILKRHGDKLIPLATRGLSEDTLGRHFIISEHPRFEIICNAKQVVRFPTGSNLPDPYDGLVPHIKGNLPIHGCMGIPLIFNDENIGVITFDHLEPMAFDELDPTFLSTLGTIASLTLRIAINIEDLERKSALSHQLLSEIQHDHSKEQSSIIGEHVATKRLLADIQLVASSPYTVLISGETGVGKELVAHAIHQQSNRASQPLVYVNCAALPESLIESELFGHTKGAFTGAHSERAGKFSLANGGTIFLDEVGELPLSVQSKLLRVLQANEIQPVGMDKVIHVDVRIITATNRDLVKEVAEGRFRADLFHRLSVYPIQVPPLRERASDIPLLAGYFIERATRKLGIPQLTITQAALQLLSRQQWLGNIRELEHSISRAAIRAAANRSNLGITQIDTIHLGLDSTPEISSSAPMLPSSEPSVAPPSQEQSGDLKEATANFQRDLITNALITNSGNWSATARQLNTDRANLVRLAKRLGIAINKQITTR